MLQALFPDINAKMARMGMTTGTGNQTCMSVYVRIHTEEIRGVRIIMALLYI